MRRLISLKQFGCTVLTAVALSSVAMGARPAEAGLTTNFDLASFEANMANAGLAAPNLVTFDDFILPTNISGMTIQRGGTDIRFDRNGASAPLWVVPGSITAPTNGFSPAANRANHRLFPTSGNWVLSPGGPLLEPGPKTLVEDDDLILTFDPPVRAAALDILFQSRDGDSYSRVQVFGPGGVLLYENPALAIPGSAGAPGGSAFFGAVARGSTRIWRVAIKEFDGDSGNPDSNIGYDTIRVR